MTYKVQGREAWPQKSVHPDYRGKWWWMTDAPEANAGTHVLKRDGKWYARNGLVFAGDCYWHTRAAALAFLEANADKDKPDAGAMSLDDMERALAADIRAVGGMAAAQLAEQLIARDWVKREWVTPQPDAVEGAAMLNLDHEESRALHRIVRAMHDGECPKCHSIHDSSQMIVWDRSGNTGQGEKYRHGWRCPTCKFQITNAEAKAVSQMFAPFMERNLAVLEKWRVSHFRHQTAEQAAQRS